MKTVAPDADVPVGPESFRTGRGNDLHGSLWRPSGPARGAVLVVHGLGDHGGRYQSWASDLAGHGWATMAFDLRGHGRSPGWRGHVRSYDHFLEDISIARTALSQRCERLPQVVFGHSMGGNLLLNYLLRRSEFDREDAAPIRAAILCAPMLSPPGELTRPLIFAAWLTGHLMPWIPVGRSIDSESLTGDREQSRIIAGDPLRHSKISIFLATQLLSQGRWAIDNAREIELPTLITYGEADGLIDRAACEHVAIRIGDSASVIGWPAMRHDLLHETDRAAIKAQMLDWLDPYRATPAEPHQG